MTLRNRQNRKMGFARARWSLRHDGEMKKTAGFAFLRRLSAVLFAVLFLAMGYHVMAAEKSPADQRNDANKAQRAGNFKDAMAVYSKLLADPNDDKTLVLKDLVNVVQCAAQLGREDEVDDLIEKAVVTIRGVVYFTVGRP